MILGLTGVFSAVISEVVWRWAYLCLIGNIQSGVDRSLAFNVDFFLLISTDSSITSL